MAAQALPEASAWVVDTSRAGGWLRSEASAPVTAGLQSWVLVLVVLLVVTCVWVLLLVQHRRHCHQRHRPAAELLVQHQRHCHQRHRPETGPLGPEVLVRAPQLPIQQGPRGLDR